MRMFCYLRVWSIYLFQKPHNVVRYEITGSSKALEYFLVNEVTGDLYVKKPLTEDDPDTDSYTVSPTFIFS